MKAAGAIIMVDITRFGRVESPLFDFCFRAVGCGEERTASFAIDAVPIVTASYDYDPDEGSPTIEAGQIGESRQSLNLRIKYDWKNDGSCIFLIRMR